MAIKSLQAELVITAADKTGKVFDRVAARIDTIAAAGARFDSVGRNFLNVASAVDKSGHSIGEAGVAVGLLHGRMQRLDRAFAKNIGSISGFTRALGSGVAQMTAYAAVYETFSKTAVAAAAGQHERVRMEAAGMKPEEIKSAEAVSADLSKKYPSLSQTAVLHLLRNVRSVVGSYAEAGKLIEPLMQLHVVTEGAHPERAEELEPDFDKITKAMEVAGRTMDPAQFAKDMQLAAKAMNVFGDTLRPYDLYEFVQHSRQAGQSFSDEFLLGVGPTLMQSMGGAAAGTAMAAFYQQFVGGHMTKAAAGMLEKYHLLDPHKIDFTKAGLIKRIEPGALLEGELAKQNPYQWIQQVLLPALQRGGVTKKEDFENIGAVLASKQTTGMALGILGTQQARIEKDLALERGAEGLEAYKRFQTEDPTMAMHGFTEQLNNLLQVAGGPLAKPAAEFLNSMAQSIGGIAQTAQRHPALQQTATSGLESVLGGVGLSLWEGGLWFARNRMAAATLSKLRWAPTALWPLALGTYAHDVWKGVSDELINAKGLTSIDKLAIASSALDPSGGMAALYLESPAFSSRLGASEPAPAPELKGDATLNVHVTIDHDGAHVDSSVSGGIPGVNVHGSTGETGKNYDDVPGL